MKSSFLTGLSLTLLMLLLVLGAAFVFLFQGRKTLQERADTATANVAVLEDDLKETATDLAASEATRVATDHILATAESGAVLLEGQLVDSQQQLDDLSATAEALASQLGTAQDTLSQQEDQQQARLPVVKIISPEEDDAFLPGEAIALVVSAADPGGISAVSLNADGQPLDSQVVDDEPLVTLLEQWTPAESGTHTVSALAASSSGLTSLPVTVTITVINVDVQNLSLLEQVEGDVAELRGLAATEPAVITFLSQEELAQRATVTQSASLQTAILSDFALTLSAFDFLEREFDISGAMASLEADLGEAAHDPLAMTSIFVQEEAALGPAAILAYAHDYTHLLQAQQHSQLLAAQSVAVHSDTRDALHALVEGEAELVESLYLSGGFFSEAQLAQLASTPGDGEVTPLDAYPAILVKQHAFARTAGFAFVSALYQEGEESFDLIDAAWEDPPVSSEQILHPDRYLEEDGPLQVELPLLTAALGTEWALRDEGTVGEFLLREYLLQQLDEGQAETAAAGWGGDKYAVYWNDSDEALALVYRILWDTVPDSAEFAALYPSYPTRLFGVNGELQLDGGECWRESDVICFYREGGETVIVRAPDLETAGELIQALAQFSGG